MVSTCPGCGLRQPAGGQPADPRRNCSWECWLVHGEVVGFELSRPPLGRVHQLTVDAYAAQHAGPSVPPIGPAFALAGLHLALVEGLAGAEVRSAHQRMAALGEPWPAFGAIPARVPLTVLDVAEAGARRGSAAGHEAAVRSWAAAVWSAWSPRHGEVAALVARCLGR